MTNPMSDILQISQINISGLSKRSHSALDRYNYCMKNDILLIQETLLDPADSNQDLPSFTNMTSFYLKNDKGVCTNINSS